MPTPDDLMGFGMAPFVAGELGNRPNTVVCSGTVQSGAAAIIEHLSLINAANSGSLAAILPSSGKVGTPYFISGGGTSAPRIFCPVGQTLNGTVNGSINFSASNASGLFIQMTLNNWYCIPLAP